MPQPQFDGFYDVRNYYQGLQDKDREVAKWKSDMEMARLNQEKQTLSNMFSRDTYNTEVQRANADLEGVILGNQAKKQEADDTKFLSPYLRDAKMKELISKAKKEDLAAMYAEGQRLYMDPRSSPEQKTMGRNMMMAHPDFVKLQENNQNKVEVQQMRGEVSTRNAAMRAAGKGGGSGSTKPPTLTQIEAQYTAQLADALQRGDAAGAENANSMLNRIAQHKASQRVDTSAGKPTITPDGKIGTIPAKQLPSVPPYIPPAGKSQQAGHSLADVQKLYPGVPVDQLKARYKQKFGVDLK